MEKVFVIFWIDEQGLTFFVGVATSQEETERLIGIDMQNVKSNRNEYVVIERWVNYPYPAKIEKSME